MNLYSSSGQKVRYSLPFNGWDNDQLMARKELVLGEIYTIQKIEVGEYQSRVYLVEKPGKAFNTVLFESIIHDESELSQLKSETIPNLERKIQELQRALQDSKDHVYRLQQKLAHQVIPKVHDR
jgi:predicted RNase H-like nuclease (RuvC/YqgF family)